MDKSNATLFIEYDVYTNAAGAKQAICAINGFQPFLTTCCLDDWNNVIDYIKGCKNIKAVKVTMTKEEKNSAKKGKGIKTIYCRPNPVDTNTVIAEFEPNRFNVISKTDFYYLWHVFGRGYSPKKAAKGERFYGYGGVSENKQIFTKHKKGTSAKVIPVAFMDDFSNYSKNAVACAKRPITSPVIVMQRYNNKYDSIVAYNKAAEEAKAKMDADYADIEDQIKKINDKLEKDIAQAKKDAKAEEAKIRKNIKAQQDSMVKAAKKAANEEAAKAKSKLSKSEKKKLVQANVASVKQTLATTKTSALNEVANNLETKIAKLKKTAKADIAALNAGKKSFSKYFDSSAYDTDIEEDDMEDDDTSVEEHVNTRVGWFGEAISDVVNKDIPFEKIYGSMKQFLEENWGSLTYEYVYDKEKDSPHTDAVQTPKVFIEYTDHAVGTTNLTQWCMAYDDEILFFPYETIGFRITKKTADRIKWLLGKFGEYVKTYKYSYRTGSTAPDLYINPVYTDTDESTAGKPKIYQDTNGEQYIQLKAVSKGYDNSTAEIANTATAYLYSDKELTTKLIQTSRMTEVSVLSYGTKVSRIIYDGVTGYIESKYLNFGISDTNHFVSLKYYEEEKNIDIEKFFNILGTKFISIEDLNICDQYDYREGDWKPGEIPVEDEIPEIFKNATDEEIESDVPGTDSSESSNSLEQVVLGRTINIPIQLYAWLYSLVYDTGEVIDWVSADGEKTYRTKYLADLNTEDGCYTLFNENWVSTSEPYFGPTVADTNVNQYTEKKYMRELSHFYDEMIPKDPIKQAITWVGEYWINRKILNSYETPSIPGMLLKIDANGNDVSFDMRNMFQTASDRLDICNIALKTLSSHTEDYFKIHPEVLTQKEEVEKEIAFLTMVILQLQKYIFLYKLFLDSAGTWHLDMTLDDILGSTDLNQFLQIVGDLMTISWYNTSFEIYPYELPQAQMPTTLVDNDFITTAAWTTNRYSDFRTSAIPVYITDILTGLNKDRWASESFEYSPLPTKPDGTVVELPNAEVATALHDELFSYVSIAYTEQIYTPLYLNQATNKDKKERLEKARANLLKVTDVKNWLYETKSDVWKPYLNYEKIFQKIKAEIPKALDEVRDAAGYTEEYKNGLLNDEVLYHAGNNRYYRRSGDGFYVYLDLECSQKVQSPELFYIEASKNTALIKEMVKVKKSTRELLDDKLANEKIAICDLMIDDVSIRYIEHIPVLQIESGWRMRNPMLDYMTNRLSITQDADEIIELRENISDMLAVIKRTPDNHLDSYSYCASVWKSIPEWFKYMHWENDVLTLNDGYSIAMDMVRYYLHPTLVGYRPRYKFKISRKDIANVLASPVMIDIVNESNTDSNGIYYTTKKIVPIIHTSLSIGEYCMTENPTEFQRTHAMDVLEYLEKGFAYDPASVHTRYVQNHGISTEWNIMEARPVFMGASLVYKDVPVIDPKPEFPKLSVVNGQFLLYMNDSTPDELPPIATTKNIIMKQPQVGFGQLMIDGYEFVWLDFTKILIEIEVSPATKDHPAIHDYMNIVNNLVEVKLKISGMEFNGVVSLMMFKNRTYLYDQQTNYGKLLNQNFVDPDMVAVKVHTIRVHDVENSIYEKKYKGVLVYSGDYYYHKFVGKYITLDSSGLLMQNMFAPTTYMFPECMSFIQDIIYHYYEWYTEEFKYFDETTWKPVYEKIYHYLIVKDEIVPLDGN